MQSKHKAIKTKQSKYASQEFHSEINITCSLYAVLYPCNKKHRIPIVHEVNWKYVCVRVLKPLKHFSFNALASAPHPHAPQTN